MKGIAITISGVTHKFSKIDCDAGVCMIRFWHIYYKDIVGNILLGSKTRFIRLGLKMKIFTKQIF